jgi:hypothetical protein
MTNNHTNGRVPVGFVSSQPVRLFGSRNNVPSVFLGIVNSKMW